MKPVLGVSDGLSNVMQGVSNEVSGDSKSASKGSQQIRPRRTFQFSTVRRVTQLHGKNVCNIRVSFHFRSILRSKSLQNYQCQLLLPKKFSGL